jgi:protein O-mannosyl-transferase
MAQVRPTICFLIATIIVLPVAAAYWPALHGGFIFDDYPIFAENPAIQVHGWQLQNWRSVWDWSLHNIERPMAMLTYAFNYAMGSGTFGFKLTNLIIHLLNTWLALAVTQRLLGAAWPKQAPKAVLYWAAGIAFAWAIHPLQVSTVMYVVQRMEMLAFTFVLLALLAYWRGRQQQLEGQRAWPWFLLATTSVLAGYCFKETAILAPGYAWLIEATVLRYKARDASTERNWRVFYLAGMALAVVVTAAYIVPHYATPAYYAGRDFTAWQRELTQLRALPLYLGWILLPLPRHFTFYYDNYLASTSLLDPITTLMGGLAMLALLAFAIIVHRRRPLLALGIGWFFIAHALTCAPLPLELIFEHRNYPALLGIVLAVADVLYLLVCRSGTKAFVVVACVLLGNLAFLTLLRSTVWSSPFRLSVELVDINPGSTRAAVDLARRYMAMSGGRIDSPLYAKSIAELERAARLPNTSPLGEHALLLEAARNPQIQAQPWWDSFRSKLATRPLIPDTYMALHQLATVRLKGDAGIDARQLAECYAIAVRRNPNRELVQADYAELLGGILHEQEVATEHWKLALALDPDPSTYGPRLANYLLANHRNAEAEAVILKTMELKPALRADHSLQALLEKAKAQETTTDTSFAEPVAPR